MIPSSLSGLHHLALKVGDLVQAENFYHQILGLPILEKQKDEKGNPRSVWLKIGETILMLEVSASKSKEKPDSLWPVVALQISVNERLKWKKFLEEKGVTVESESPFSLYFRDTEGNRLALTHYPESK